MSLISGTGTPIPNSFQFYDFLTASFTVAAGATGNRFAVPGSTRIYPISASKNLVPVDATYDNVLKVAWFAISARVATVSTNAYIILPQFSIDGGSTWADFAAMDATTPAGGAANRVVVSTSTEVATNIIPTTAAITGNAIHIRTSVLDNTDPTTDIWTVTDLRVSMAMVLMK